MIFFLFFFQLKGYCHSGQRGQWLFLCTDRSISSSRHIQKNYQLNVFFNCQEKGVMCSTWLELKCPTWTLANVLQLQILPNVLDDRGFGNHLKILRILWLTKGGGEVFGGHLSAECRLVCMMSTGELCDYSPQAGSWCLGCRQRSTRAKG